MILQNELNVESDWMRIAIRYSVWDVWAELLLVSEGMRIISHRAEEYIITSMTGVSDLINTMRAITVPTTFDSCKQPKKQSPEARKQ